MNVKIAVVQPLTIKGEDQDRKNTVKALEYIEAAKDKGAQIICLPESYPGPWKAPITFSPFDELSVKAKEEGVYVIAGSAEPADETRVYNTLLFISPRGELIGTYRRTTPPGPWIYLGGEFWDFNYKEADVLPVFGTDFGKVGLLICSEVYMPELSRILALKGAEIVFLPAGIWKGELWETWRHLIWSRAIENLMYTATCQNIFKPDKEDGLAMIAGPEEIIVESKKVGVFTAELDLDRIRWLRETSDRWPPRWKAKPGVLKEWRRPELYRKALPELW